MKDSIAVCPISANPPTRGHADIIQRAAGSFSLVYWVAAINLTKKYFFPPVFQLEMMRDYVEYFKLDNVIVEHFEGSLVRFAMEKKANFILRGVRNTSDLQAEMELAAGYRGINSKIETVCFFANPELMMVSSSLVRQLIILEEDIDKYTLPSIARKIRRAYDPKTQKIKF